VRLPRRQVGLRPQAAGGGVQCLVLHLEGLIVFSVSALLRSSCQKMQLDRQRQARGASRWRDAQTPPATTADRQVPGCVMDEWMRQAESKYCVAVVTARFPPASRL
jgi:hypothetical protein